MSKAKIYIVIVIGLIFIFLIGTINVLNSERKKEKSEKELYIRNTNNLLDTIQTYRANDSLNVASVGKLELKLSEYNKLKIDKKKLEQVTTTQTQTIYELKGSVRDSIVYRDKYIVDTLRCVTIRAKWFDMDGCIDKLNEFKGRFENRDSIAIVNHVKQKRFLGFLWYYGKKEHRVEVVSKNPNTKITGVEYIELRD